MPASNHHYGFHLTGKHSTMKKINLSDKPDQLWENHGMAEKWVAVDKQADPARPRLFGDVAPTSQTFSEGNVSAMHVES